MVCSLELMVETHYGDTHVIIASGSKQAAVGGAELVDARALVLIHAAGAYNVIFTCVCV